MVAPDYRGVCVCGVKSSTQAPATGRPSSVPVTNRHPTAAQPLRSHASLIDGQNVVAVEIHNNSPSSSDISFNLYLKAIR